MQNQYLVTRSVWDQSWQDAPLKGHPPKMETSPRQYAAGYVGEREMETVSVPGSGLGRTFHFQQSDVPDDRRYRIKYHDGYEPEGTWPESLVIDELGLSKDCASRPYRAEFQFTATRV